MLKLRVDSSAADRTVEMDHELPDIDALLSESPTGTVVVRTPFGATSHRICKQVAVASEDALAICAGIQRDLLPGQTAQRIRRDLSPGSSISRIEDAADCAAALQGALGAFARRGGRTVAWCHLHRADRVTREALAAAVADLRTGPLGFVLGTSIADSGLPVLFPGTYALVQDGDPADLVAEALEVSPDAVAVLAALGWSPGSSMRTVFDVAAACEIDAPAAFMELGAEGIIGEDGQVPAELCLLSQERIPDGTARRLRYETAQRILVAFPGEAARLLADARCPLPPELREQGRRLLDDAMAESRFTYALDLVELLDTESDPAEAATLALVRSRLLSYLGRHDEARTVLAGSGAAHTTSDALAERAATRAWIELMSGNRLQARTHLTDVEALDPDDEDLKAALCLAKAFVGRGSEKITEAFDAIGELDALGNGWGASATVTRFLHALLVEGEETCAAVTARLRESPELEVRLLAESLAALGDAVNGRFLTARATLARSFDLSGTFVEAWGSRPGPMAAISTYVSSGCDLEAMSALLRRHPSPPTPPSDFGPLVGALSAVAWMRASLLLGRGRDIVRLRDAAFHQVSQLPLTAAVAAPDLLDAGIPQEAIEALHPGATQPLTPYRAARMDLAHADAGLGVGEAELRAGLATFEELGAPVEAARVRRHLRRFGDRDWDSAVAGGRSAFDGLTPRQVEIGRMAASGMTNREIGARLAISDKTVRNQLSVVYQVLDAARGDLGRLIS